MKSAGQSFSNLSVSPGKPMVAHDAIAESNQTSNMSSTLLIVPPQEQGKVISSTYGLCGSVKFDPALSLRPAIVPKTSWFSQESHFQTGIGIPQYLCLDMHQSLDSDTKSWNLALPAHSGYHLTFAISSSICFFIRGIAMNHCSVASEIIGVLQRQQCP